MLQWWQEPSDNLLSFLSGKYQYLPLFSCKKWQEPWQEPFLNYPQLFLDNNDLNAGLYEGEVNRK